MDVAHKMDVTHASIGGCDGSQRRSACSGMYTVRGVHGVVLQFTVRVVVHTGDDWRIQSIVQLHSKK